MSHEPNAPFLFIIDTADYAGNFERDLCAYITGNVGECGVGQDMADLFFAEVSKEPFLNVLLEADEHGCHRPATIYRNSSKYYHSVAISFEEKPTTEQIEIMKERAIKFASMTDESHSNYRISKILGFRLLEQKIIRKIKEIKV